MWRSLKLLSRTFAKIRIPEDPKMTSLEEKRLRKVVTDPAYVNLLGIKKYCVNDDVVYDGAANVINWDDRMIGKMTLAEARATAEKEGLDYVLMHEHPLTVRIMNFENFMFKMNNRAEALREKTKAQKCTFFTVDAYIDRKLLKEKVNGAIAAARLPGQVAMEVTILNPEDADQVQRSLDVVEQIEHMIEKYGGPRFSYETTNKGVLIRVQIRCPQAEQSHAEEKKQLNTFTKDEDEEAYVASFMASEKVLPGSELELEESMTEGVGENKAFGGMISPDAIAMLPKGPAKRRLTEEALKRALGGKLAYDVMKGKIKPLK